MEIAQSNGVVTAPWRALPAVPAELQRYADVLARHPAVGVLAVGGEGHLVFMRGAGRGELRADALAADCREALVADSGRGGTVALQAWEGGRDTPLPTLARTKAAVTVTVLDMGTQRRVTTSLGAAPSTP